MRISRLLCASVLLLTTGISGCYSGGKWSMPNLAFWKSSPFSSNSPGSTAGVSQPGSPAKPSALASNNASGTLTTAPAYQTSVTYGPPNGGLSPQYPAYPSIGSSSGAAAGAPAYTASSTNSVAAGISPSPQQGLYGSTLAPPSGSGAPANNYPNTPNSAYPNNTYPNSSYSNSSYSNPVRQPVSPSANPSSMYPSTAAGDRYGATSADRYSSSSDRYGNIPDRSAGADRYGSNADRYGSSADRYSSTGGVAPGAGNASTPPAAATAYGTSADRYAPTGSIPSGSASTLSTGAATNYGGVGALGAAPPASYNRSTADAAAAASLSDNRYGDARSLDNSAYAPYVSNANSPAAYGSGGGIAADRSPATSSSPAGVGRYPTSGGNSLDASVPPAGSGYGSGAAAGYQSGASGVAPSSAASPYAVPSAAAPAASAPAGTSNDATGYRPGSVTTYTPRKSDSSGGTVVGTPDAIASPSGITPASYER